MMQDVRSIPVAPRRIRVRPLLAHRWPLLAFGGVLCIVGSLLAWLMFLQAGGKWSDSARLDRGPCGIVTGTVQEVGPAFEDAGRTLHWVRYGFRWQAPGDGVELRGTSFVLAPPPQVGDDVDVEVLVAEPNRSRIVGGLHMLDRSYLHASFWLSAMVAPGGLLLLGWLAAAFRLRHVLVHGDVSVGRLRRVEPVPLVLPQMLRVEYEFRDHQAIARRSAHWVRVHGALGRRLLARGPGAAEPLPVLHDRQFPQHSRLLLPQDFLPPCTNTNDALSEHGVP